MALDYPLLFLAVAAIFVGVVSFMLLRLLNLLLHDSRRMARRIAKPRRRRQGRR